MKLLFFGFLSLGGSALGTAPRAHELTDDYSYEKYVADFRKTDSDNSRRPFHERLPRSGSTTATHGKKVYASTQPLDARFA